MVLGNVEETVNAIAVDPETNEQFVKVCSKLTTNCKRLQNEKFQCYLLEAMV